MLKRYVLLIITALLLAALTACASLGSRDRNKPLPTRIPTTGPRAIV